MRFEGGPSLYASRLGLRVRGKLKHGSEGQQGILSSCTAFAGDDADMAIERLEARMRPTGRRRLWIDGALLGAIVVAGCGEGDIADTPAEATAPAAEYVGEVADSEAFIAVVTDGDEVRAYVCDGHDDSVMISEWFKGELGDAAVSMASTSGEAHLDATVSADGISGTVEIAGTSRSFEAAPAHDDEGLYAFKGELEDTAAKAVPARSGNESIDVAALEARAGWVIIIPEAQGEVLQRGAVAFGDSLRANTALDLESSTATLDDFGTVTTAKVTPSNVSRFFTNGWP